MKVMIAVQTTKREQYRLRKLRRWASRTVEGVKVALTCIKIAAAAGFFICGAALDGIFWQQAFYGCCICVGVGMAAQIAQIMMKGEADDYRRQRHARGAAVVYEDSERPRETA